MKERRIIFGGPMVRAILDGRKTQTRRVMKLQPTCFPNVYNGSIARRFAGPSWQGQTLAVWPGETEFDYSDCHCPYGKPGDRLWVRETHYVWCAGNKNGAGKRIDYRATEPDSPCGGWTPSIYMPRWASRITLEVTDVRVEQLTQISVEAALAEGIEHHTMNDPRVEFQWLWDSINGEKHPWDSNPWVWVVEFKRIAQDSGESDG